MNHSKSVNKLAFVTICLMLLFPVLRAKAQRINPDVLPGAPGAPGPVTGPSTAVAGTTGTYTVTAGANATSYSWTLTTGAGTISNTGLSATVTWNSSFTGSAVVSCSSVNSVASTAATPKTVTVSPAPTPLVAGTISPSTQTINYNTAAALTGTEATGGNYTYTYQWQSSTSSGGTYTNISGATTQN